MPPAAARRPTSPRPSCSSGWPAAGWTACSQGELAEAWKPAADFKSYTIKIRKGVKFHDGKPMTTDDVAYSVDEIWKKYAAAASITDYAGVGIPTPTRS